MSNTNDDLPAAANIHRHEQSVEDSSAPFGDPTLITEISAHIEAHIGPIQGVFHEIVSAYVHVDVHHVPPSEKYPFHSLVTSGMSARAMAVAPGIPDDFRHAELVVTLPPDWQVSSAAFTDERWYWPIRLLTSTARLPHEYATWLGYGHTIPHGDPPQPYASNTRLSGVMIMPQFSLPEALHRLVRSNGDVVRFWNLLPLYREEMDFKLSRGADELLEALDAIGASDIVDPGRRNAITQKE